jgi:hypothetical protein
MRSRILQSPNLHVNILPVTTLKTRTPPLETPMYSAEMDLSGDALEVGSARTFTAQPNGCSSLMCGFTPVINSARVAVPPFGGRDLRVDCPAWSMASTKNCDDRPDWCSDFLAMAAWTPKLDSTPPFCCWLRGPLVYCMTI